VQIQDVRAKMTVDQELLKHFLRMMLRIRMFEERLIEPILQNDIRTPCHLYSGEEGIAVGLCSALSRDDYIFGNHRSHGHFLAKGGSMKEMEAEIGPPISRISRVYKGSLYICRRYPDSGKRVEAALCR
jgi:acetoin:2,6-dichlorophenolindophenol oxidoreductase subunit alpha